MKRRITFTQNAQNETDSHTAVDSLDGWSLATALSLVVRRRRFLMSTILSVAVVTAVITLFIQNKYLSRASILPSGSQDKMADLKALAGFAGMMQNDESSSELFPAILASQTIRDAVLAREYAYRDGDRALATTLTDYLQEDDPDELRMALAEITGTSSDKKTGIISISVETEFPDLSQGIVQAYVDELESFNMNKRISKGKQSADYLAAQVDIKRQEVSAAEDSLEIFQRYNRDWASSGSPEVQMMVSRLQRELQVKTVAYGYLQQQYEMARLDAQKDIPIVRILDSATLPTEKSSPLRSLIVIAVTIMATLLSIFWIFASEAWTRFTSIADKDGHNALAEELDIAFPRIRNTIQREVKSTETVG